MASAPQPAAQSHATPPISREEIAARLNDPSLAVVNVLPAETFAAGHIPGSISLPLATLRQRAAELLPDLDQEIAVYCGSFT